MVVVTPIEQTANTHVLAMSAPAKSATVAQAARDAGISPEQIVRLSANESALGLSPRARDAMVAALDGAFRYPDPNATALRHALSERFDIPGDRIVLGNGSSEVIELVSLAFLGPGRSAVFSQYSYGAYRGATRARDAVGLMAPARGFDTDLEALMKQVRPDTRVVFIDNPNNPTGSFLSGEAIRSFVAELPPDVLVVLDEAYVEFLAPEDRYDSIAWIADHPNLVIVRTLSKAYGLAGIRIGYAVTSAPVASLINRVRQNFNCNVLAQAAAVAALDDKEFLERAYTLNRAGLTQLYDGLNRLGRGYIPSHGNFVLFDAGDAAGVYQQLLERGVVVRPMTPYGLTAHLRVSVGTREQNDRFLTALEEVLSSRREGYAR